MAIEIFQANEIHMGIPRKAVSSEIKKKQSLLRKTNPFLSLHHFSSGLPGLDIGLEGRQPLSTMRKHALFPVEKALCQAEKYKLKRARPDLFQVSFVWDE